MRAIFGGLAIGLSLFTGPGLTDDAPPMTTVAQGVLAGRAETGTAVYRGIPFAAPPVGALRWRPPQPPAAWEGVRSAERLRRHVSADAARFLSRVAEGALRRGWAEAKTA